MRRPAQVVVSVKEAKNESAYFLRDVMPLFTKAGCNSAQCHGSGLGKGGFRLSLFGAEPDADYDALTKSPQDGGSTGSSRSRASCC